MIYILSFLGLVTLCAASDANSIKEIVAYVGENPCDCNVQVTVCGPEMDRCCTTNNLDNVDGFDDFEIGQADRFSGSDLLGECDGFDIEKANVFKLIISHCGSDGLVVNVWKVQFNDGRKVFCEDGYIIDNTDDHTLYCN